MPTDQPRDFPADIAGIVVPPPLEVEGGAPRGPYKNSPLDPGTPPTDAGGSDAPRLDGPDGPEQHPIW